jgi:hypothetical protein
MSFISKEDGTSPISNFELLFALALELHAE